MPNHVHIIAVPSDEDGLRRTFRYVDRHYTGYINARLRTTGHLWQGRFSSVAWLSDLEAKTGFMLAPQKRGPKPTIK
jgi:REP element-mobilizing transposase RayT